jgi:trk system potassium uptake protein
MSFKNISKVLSLIGMTVSIIFLLDILVGLIYDEDFKKFLLYDVVFFTVNLAIWSALVNHELDLKITS